VSVGLGLTFTAPAVQTHLTGHNGVLARLTNVLKGPSSFLTKSKFILRFYFKLLATLSAIDAVLFLIPSLPGAIC